MRRVGHAVLVELLVASVLVFDLWVPAACSPRAESEVPATNPFSGDQAAIAEGRSWFRAICAICHGINADAKSEREHAADLRACKLGFRASVETVKQGRDVPSRIDKMPA